MSDIRRWLAARQLAQFAEVFAEQQINVEDLPDLTDADLRELGLPMGPRKRLLRLVAASSEDAQLTEPGSSKMPVHSSPVGNAERRHMTVMFCDLVGSTALATQLDPEELRDVIRGFQDACAGAISRYGGYVARYIGDGLLVYFGFPRAHEDDAERSVRAALGIVESVGHLNATSDHQLQVRLGIASGLVVVGDIVGEGAAQEQMVVGETPNLAARLQGIARPDTVAISDATRALIGDQFECDDLGLHAMKGISEPTRAWRIANELHVQSRFHAMRTQRLSTFVGRQQEVGLLEERWAQARNGEGQVVVLGGEPGIGKSRILETFRNQVCEHEPTWVQYQCSPLHINTALYPAIRQLEFAAHFGHGDSQDQRFSKLSRLLDTSNASAEHTALIAALLSIPAEGRYALPDMASLEQKRNTLTALATVFEGLACTGSVAFTFEDIHWVDQTTLELMHLIVNRVADLPAMVIVTHRPEFVSPWREHSHCSELSLNRLSRRQCHELIASIAADADFSDGLTEQIVSRTDGIPLFVEELTKTVLESRSEIAPERDADASIRIPATLQASLLERLDRLEAGKVVAQMAAVIGREFDGELLRSMSDVDAAILSAGLSELLEAGLVFRRGAAQVARYVFKHALVCDGAYETLLRSRRTVLHARVAEVLESNLQTRHDVEPSEIAFHFKSAGRHSAAVPYWHQAGQRAVERAAANEAIAHLREGLNGLDGIAESELHTQREIDLRLSLGVAQVWAGETGTPDFEANWMRARACCEQLGDLEKLFPAVWNLWMCRQWGMQYESARTLSTELLDIAQQRTDSGEHLQAHHAAWTTQFCMGEPTAALTHAEAALDLYDLDAHREHAYVYGGHDAGVCGAGIGALSAWVTGFPDKAAQLSTRALTLSDELGVVSSRLQSRWTAAFMWQFRDDASRCLKLVSACNALAEQFEMTGVAFALGTRIVGHWASARLGDSDHADRLIQTELASPASNVFRPYYLYLLADTQTRLGRATDGLNTLDEALTYIEKVGEPWWEPEIHRLRGQLLAKLGMPPEHVVASYERARDIATKQGAKSLQLRACMSLAEWHGRDDPNDSAVTTLRQTLAGFTEGSATADLIRARSMLAELT